MELFFTKIFKYINIYLSDKYYLFCNLKKVYFIKHDEETMNMIDYY